MISPGVVIYGLFEGSRCRYVGQTRCESRRRWRHKRAYPELMFRVIRKCERIRGLAVESQIIKSFKLKGQCDLNTYFIGRKGRKSDLTGRKFGILTAESFAFRQCGSPAWWCNCECGSRVPIRSRELREGSIKSCGYCRWAEGFRKRGRYEPILKSQRHGSR